MAGNVDSDDSNLLDIEEFETDTEIRYTGGTYLQTF